MTKILCLWLGLWCPTLADHLPEIERSTDHANKACQTINMKPTLPTYCSDGHGHFWSESGTTCHPAKADRRYPVCACTDKDEQLVSNPWGCDAFDWDESMIPAPIEGLK